MIRTLFDDFFLLRDLFFEFGGDFPGQSMGGRAKDDGECYRDDKYQLLNTSHKLGGGLVGDVRRHNNLTPQRFDELFFREVRWFVIATFYMDIWPNFFDYRKRTKA